MKHFNVGSKAVKNENVPDRSSLGNPPVSSYSFDTRKSIRYDNKTIRLSSPDR